MDTEGLNGPEGGAGLGSIERGADPGALLPGGLVKNRLNRSGVSVTRKTRSLFLGCRGSIQAAEGDFMGEAIERGS